MSRADTLYSTDGGTIVVDTTVPQVSGCVVVAREGVDRQRQNTKYRNLLKEKLKNSPPNKQNRRKK